MRFVRSLAFAIAAVLFTPFATSAQETAVDLFENEDGTFIFVYRDGNGDYRARDIDAPDDGSLDRVYGRDFDLEEIRDRERYGGSVEEREVDVPLRID